MSGNVALERRRSNKLSWLIKAVSGCLDKDPSNRLCDKDYFPSRIGADVFKS